jgi:hypothetical protein
MKERRLISKEAVHGVSIIVDEDGRRGGQHKSKSPTARNPTCDGRENPVLQLHDNMVTVRLRDAFCLGTKRDQRGWLNGKAENEGAWS